MHTRSRFAKTGLVAALASGAVLTVVQASAQQLGSSAIDQIITKAGQSAGDKSCPSTATGGCSVTGISQPNGLNICKGTSTNVHSSATAADQTANLALWTTQLCNTQAIDPATWVYGPSNDLTLAQEVAPFWNKVMQSMTRGLPITGHRWADPYGADYCSTATYAIETNDFNWADEMHSGLDNSGIWTAWGTIDTNASSVPPNSAAFPYTGTATIQTENAPTNCGLTPATLAERGEFGSSLDEREAQHGADGGGDLFMRPVTSVRDAQEAIFWSFWPPFGHRSQGFSTAQYNSLISASGAGPYRASYNMNIVMMAVIQTVDGAQSAEGIAALDGIDALVIDDQDLALQANNATQAEKLVDKITKAATKNRKYLCHINWSDTPSSITCTGPAPTFGGYWPNRRLDANGMPVGSPTTFAALGKE